MPPVTDNLVTRHSVLPGLSEQSPGPVLLKAASASDMRSELCKAGVEKELLPGVHIQIRPNHAYMFVISLGSGEYYSHNENADYYPEKEGKVVTFSEPVGPKQMTLGKGIKERHESFSAIGKVYRHHHTKQTHGSPPLGNIPWDRYNEQMHRGELIIELPTKEWEKELHLHESGTPLMWSQGSGVPFDACSRCGHLFDGEKVSKRCVHSSKERLCIGPDGLPNMIYCPDPVFFDISYVGNNPAAKIAFGLLKLAEAEDEGLPGVGVDCGGPADAFRRVYCVSLRPREDVLSRLVLAEKDVSDDMVPGIQQALLPDPQQDADFVKVCQEADLNEVVPSLIRTKIVLTPTQWYRIFMSNQQGEPSGVSGFLGALPSVFDRVSREPDKGFLSDTSYLPVTHSSPTIMRQLEPHAQALSAGPQIKITVIRNAQAAQVCQTEPTARDRYLAREYARYQVQTLAAPGMPDISRWCALVNRAGI